MAVQQAAGSAMEGKGAYNANSALQASGAAIALPLLEQAATVIPLDSTSSPVVIADYGSSEGRNSVAAISRAIRQLRRRTDRPVLVVHTDLPDNDFTTLFQLAASEQGGYEQEDTFVGAVGRSFYEPVLPPSFVHLGWSSYAAHWLSQRPGPITDHIFPERGKAHERAAFTQQARGDWEKFLALRIRELASGGRLVIAVPAPDERGSHPMLALFDCAVDALVAMEQEGTLRREDRTAMAIPQHLRTLDEMLAPFADGQLRDQAQVLSCSISPIGDAAHQAFLTSGDAEVLAMSRTGFFRATFAPTLASTVPDRGRLPLALRGADPAAICICDAAIRFGGWRPRC